MKQASTRVLIVDDEIQPQLQTQHVLQQSGFECDLALDGQAALAMLAGRDYQVVITELILPHTNGGELVIRLCAQKPAPIVVVHTRVIEQEVSEGLWNEGVDAIFYKPADYLTMARRVQSLVGRRVLAGRQGTWSHRGKTGFLNTLRIGDRWIENSRIRVEAFRFVIMILGCVLFSLGWGNSLDHEAAGLCKMFGLCGFAFFLCLALVAYHRERHHSKLLQWSVERRLAEQMEFQTHEGLASNSPPIHAR